MANNMLNNIWPEWQIEDKPLGRGSYGVVYKAIRRDHDVESFSAIKVISIPQNESELDSLRSEGLSKDATRTYLQGVVSDFVSEIRLMESFKGVQNIVSVEDYKVIEKTDEVGWDIYIRMELLTPFNSYISDKTLSEEEVIKLGMDICTALELCAERDVIHRDIKPQNIFINQFGHFKLGDFGIARKLENVTGGLSQKGSPNYMAPEVAHSTQYDATVDLYSLGIVLYQLMNKNRLPFLDTERQLLNPNERAAALKRRLEGESLPVPCDASPAMAEVILCASNPDPSKRFVSAKAMKNALMSVENGTYTSSEAELNKTISVRHATQTQDPNRTTSVRKAPQTEKSAQKKVEIFGGKKKSKTPAIIAMVLAVALLICGGVFIVPRFLGNNDSQESSSVGSSANTVAEDSDSSDSALDGKNGVYSDFDEEQIAAAIEEAEALAADEDYEGALTKVKTALVTYPKSEELKAKETEYTDALAAQAKAKTLEEAANLAESGDYVSAIALIRNAQESNDADPDYANAYNTYCASYKVEAINSADKLAGSGDYLGAIQTIAEANAVIGDDSELTVKSQGYEDAYVSSVISQAEELLTVKDYDGADKLVNAARKQFRNNVALIEEAEIIANARPISFVDVCAPYNLNDGSGCKLYTHGATFSMAGKTYTNGFMLATYNTGSDTWALSNLEGKYSELSFLVGHVDGGANSNVSLEVYLDGNLFDTYDIPYDGLPLSITIPVDSVQQIKFYIKSCRPYIGFANLMLTINSDYSDMNNGNDDSSMKSFMDVCAPYNLNDGSGCKLYTSGATFSMAGKTYTNGFMLATYNTGSDTWALSNLEGKYSELSFLVGHVDGGANSNVSLEVYLDGNLFDTYDIPYDGLPLSITIPVDSVQQIKFYIKSCRPYIGFANLKII